MALLELKPNGKLVKVKIIAPDGAGNVGRIIAPGQTAQVGDIVTLPEDGAAYFISANIAVEATQADIQAAGTKK